MSFGGFCGLFLLFFVPLIECGTIEGGGNGDNSVEKLDKTANLDIDQIASEDKEISGFLQVDNENSFGQSKNIGSKNVQSKNVGSKNVGSKFCSVTSPVLAGCVMSSLIPRDKTYLIEFEDSNNSNQYPSVCWKTCSLIFPNTTLALVARSGTDSTKLVCHCTLEDALAPSLLGPEIFCNAICTESEGVFPCGGQLTFEDSDVTEMYFSIYCINGTTASLHGPLAVTATSDITTITTILSPITSTPGDTSLEKILQSLAEGNVISLVIIGLMVCLLILVLVLISWLYLFVETFRMNESTAFYGWFSKPSGLQPAGSDTKNIRALHDGGNDIEDNVMFPSDKEIVKHEGRSTFYESKTTFDDDSFSQSSVLTESADQCLNDGMKKQSKY